MLKEEESMALRVKQSGNFRKTEKTFKKAKQFDPKTTLQKYADLGLQRLKEYTPKDTGKTASSWAYTITEKEGVYTIQWTNSNINKGINIAVLIQYGHVTESGTYVPGVDYINPALKPVLESLSKEIGKKVGMR